MCDERLHNSERKPTDEGAPREPNPPMTTASNANISRIEPAVGSTDERAARSRPAIATAPKAMPVARP